MQKNVELISNFFLNSIRPQPEIDVKVVMGTAIRMRFSRKK